MEILVVLEHNNQTIHRMSWEAIAAGQSLGKDLDLSTAILIMGSDVSTLTEETATKDVDEVLIAEHPLLETYTADGYARTLAQVVESEQPTYVILGHTYMVRDFLPKVCAILKRPLLGDNISYHIKDSRPVFIKQIFMGKLLAEVLPQGNQPYLITFQSAAFQSDSVRRGTGAAIRNLSITLTNEIIKTRSEDPFLETTIDVDLSSADIIISVGRGIGKKENIHLVKELAEVMGAQIACSRPVVDAGWLPPYHQVGSSGQTVSPKLYFALGISGAIQHLVGMKGANNVIVINKDPNAPFFEIADYGTVGNILEIIPKLTEAIKKG
ncbi:MAG: electron transfer flavoprotein subunit alpha/FixB family protein [Candidatus Marinimicrobia bacterium]|nr:electron transfer flavoprotein subunit alpha/FixB family protein [Candidatus Neomarinimicrobiota bacterium]